MKGPYQIYRNTIKDEMSSKPVRYRFDLVNMVTNAVVDYCFTSAPIPPAKIRKYQAKLNTKAFFDEGWFPPCTECKTHPLCISACGCLAR